LVIDKVVKIYVESKFAAGHPIMQARYVQEVLRLAGDTSLYERSPEELEELRTTLFKSELDFFYSNSKKNRVRMDNLNIKPETAELQDVLQMAIFSDDLRGDGLKNYIIDDVPTGGKINTSSGTTGKAPVSVYFSPIDYEIMRRMNNSIITYLQNQQVDANSLVLMLVAPEMRKVISSVEYVSDWLGSLHVPTIHSMKTDENGKIKTPFGTFSKDMKAVMKYFNKDRFFGGTQKIIYGGNDGLNNLFKGFVESKGMKKFLTKLSMGIPPISLGRNGFVWSGGGPKGSGLTYEQIRDKYIFSVLTKDENGDAVPAKWIDVLAGTEFQPAIPTIPSTSIRIHHPLSKIFLVDMSKYKLIDGTGEGSLLVHSPFTTYPMAIIPGDILRRVSLPNGLKSQYPYLKYGYEYVRRMTSDEGNELRSGCPMPE
jgi:hypothetical protein